MANEGPFREGTPVEPYTITDVGVPPELAKPFDKGWREATIERLIPPRDWLEFCEKHGLSAESLHVTKKYRTKIPAVAIAISVSGLMVLAFFLDTRDKLATESRITLLATGIGLLLVALLVYLIDYRRVRAIQDELGAFASKYPDLEAPKYWVKSEVDPSEVHIDELERDLKAMYDAVVQPAYTAALAEHDRFKKEAAVRTRKLDKEYSVIQGLPPALSDEAREKRESVGKRLNDARDRHVALTQSIGQLVSELQALQKRGEDAKKLAVGAFNARRNLPDTSTDVELLEHLLREEYGARRTLWKVMRELPTVARRTQADVHKALVEVGFIEDESEKSADAEPATDPTKLRVAPGTATADDPDELEVAGAAKSNAADR